MENSLMAFELSDNSGTLYNKIQCLAHKSRQLETRLRQCHHSSPASIEGLETELANFDLRQRKLQKLETKLKRRVVNKFLPLEQTLGGGAPIGNDDDGSRCSTPAFSPLTPSDDDMRQCSTPRRIEKKLEKLQSKVHKLERKLNDGSCSIFNMNKLQDSNYDVVWQITSLQNKVHFLDDKSTQFGKILRQFWEQQLMATAEHEQSKIEKENMEFKKRKLLKLEMKLFDKFHIKLRQIERKYLGGGNPNNPNSIEEFTEAISPYGAEEKSANMKPKSVLCKLERLMYKLNKWKIKFNRIGEVDLLASPLATFFALGTQKIQPLEQEGFLPAIEVGNKDDQWVRPEPVASKRKLIKIDDDEKRRQEATKSCLVCGDVATGIHYEVLSCNGCKTFFRRTVLTGRQYVCRQGENCRFDRNGRCACRACRFRLCVEAGMSEHAIRRTPSANFILSIARRHFRHLPSGAGTKRNCTSPHIFHAENPLPLSTSVPARESAEDQFLQENPDPLQIIQHLLCIEERLSRLRHSTFFPANMEIRIAEAIAVPSILAESSKYPKVSKWPPRPGPEVPYEEYTHLGVKFWFFLDLYLGMEYLKTFEFFRAMECQSKILLTKSVVVPNQILTTSYTSLQVHSDIIQYPDGYSPFKNDKRDLMPLEEKIRKGAIEQLRAFRPDQVQIALIRAILVFNEHCDRLTPVVRQQIGTIRSKVCRVLFTYLNNKHGAEAGMRQYADSLNFISTLFEKQKLHHNYYIYRKFVLRNVCQIPLFQDFMDPDMIS